MERQRKTFSKFKSVKPKAINLGEVDLIKKSYEDPQRRFPLIIEPKTSDVDLIDWAAGHCEMIEKELLVHGAVLFRGFGIGSVKEFERFCLAVCPRLYDQYGDLPKEQEAEKIYQATPYPPHKTILFHNESSHMHCWPMKQFFHCVIVARKGGETPIVDCREMYKRLDPSIRARFEEKGLIYVRNFLKGIDVSWQDFFKTAERAEVERRCRDASFGYRWINGDELQIEQRASAVLRHPRTGEKVFFNQVQLHHESCLDEDLRESLTSLFDNDRLPRNVVYGDGTPIERSVMDEVSGLYWELAVASPWREGDALVVDNMLVAHARKPYEGPRRIAVAMGEMIDAASLSNGTHSSDTK